MTQLTYAIRDVLVEDTELMSLLGTSTLWPDGWIFSDDIYVTVENSSSVALVITENGQHETPRSASTVSFPRVFIDVWADPTRNTDNSVQIPDAKDKIMAVGKLVKKHLHTVNLDDGNGQIIVWGSPDQITDRTGVFIAGSEELSGPDINPIMDSNGSYMGRFVYGVTQIS